MIAYLPFRFFCYLNGVILLSNEVNNPPSLYLSLSLCHKHTCSSMESHCSSFIVTILLLFPVYLVAGKVFARPHCDFPAIFNFGDSNSDTGGLSAAFGQAPPPNGESYFRGPAGRYSDGRLVIDFIGIFFFSLLFCFLFSFLFHFHFFSFF